MIFAPTAFFNDVRGPLFAGSMTSHQVNGMNAILSAWQAACPDADARWLAYALATAYHETARTMQPIREYGLGRGRSYGTPDPQTGQVYYGRGLVQLTWKMNYAKLGARIGVDLVNHPDLALDPVNAASIMILGMTEGDFTTEKFADFFNEDENDPIGARRIINGQDCAAQIAVYCGHFLAAIDAATPLT
jgi:predicted chitinase